MATSKAVLQCKRQHPRGGRPAWEIAYLFPPQGNWTQQQYLDIENQCGGHVRVELYNGRLEVLPMPTQSHQLILRFLLGLLEAFVVAHAPGMVLFSGVRVRLGSRRKKPQFREPDIVYMRDEHSERRHEEYWDGADLVMEVVSGDPKDVQRDLVVKKREYARGGIPEYWIVDPENGFIQVHRLEGEAYQLHGEFRRGQHATSLLLRGFSASVDQVLDAGNGK